MNTTQNLRNLLVVGERILSERLPIGFQHVDCGAYACWFGWYARCNGLGRFGNTYTEFAEPHFGLTHSKLMTLFAVEGFKIVNGQGWRDKDFIASDSPGPEAYAELERRLVILRSIIAEREPKRTGLPVSVREIFNQPVEA